jgi:hypothetical protein
MGLRGRGGAWKTRTASGPSSSRPARWCPAGLSPRGRGRHVPLRTRVPPATDRRERPERPRPARPVPGGGRPRRGPERARSPPAFQAGGASQPHAVHRASSVRTDTGCRAVGFRGPSPAGHPDTRGPPSDGRGEPRPAQQKHRPTGAAGRRANRARSALRGPHRPRGVLPQFILEGFASCEGVESKVQPRCVSRKGSPLPGVVPSRNPQLLFTTRSRIVGGGRD